MGREPRPAVTMTPVVVEPDTVMDGTEPADWHPTPREGHLMTSTAELIVANTLKNRKVRDAVADEFIHLMDLHAHGDTVTYPGAPQALIDAPNAPGITRGGREAALAALEPYAVTVPNSLKWWRQLTGEQCEVLAGAVKQALINQGL